jgi:serine protease
MIRFRLGVFAILVCALLLISGRRGNGQGAAPAARRMLIPNRSHAAIDRGVARPPTESQGVPRLSTRATAGPVTAGTALPGGVVGERVGASRIPYRPGQVIVKFRPFSSTAGRASALAAASRTASIRNRPAYADFDVVSINPSEDAEEVARTLSTRADVEYAQPSYTVRPRFVPNDPLYKMQWDFPAIDIERAWDIQPGATDAITVAVVDTGVAFQTGSIRYSNVAGFPMGGQMYPALGTIEVPFAMASELAPSTRFVSPFDFIWGDTMAVDMDGHGTHVSGTIGQTTNDGIGTAGIAFNVKLMPVKVINTDWDDIFGSPNAGTDDIVAQGIRYAADKGAKIINMSIGRTGPSGCGANRNLPGCAPTIEDAIRYAVGKGCFVAIAGGNSYEEGNAIEVIGEIASRVPGAISVAATDPLHNRSYYSSTGSWVEIAAPGGSFRTFGDAGLIYQQTFDLSLVYTFLLPPAQFKAPRFDMFQYAGRTVVNGLSYAFQGTSMATPHVTGLAALLMQQGVTDPAAIEAAIERFATDLGPAGRDDQFGYGEINARNTLRGLGLAR